jgi:hypothetical protein
MAKALTPQDHLGTAHTILHTLESATFDIVTLRKPHDMEEAMALAKFISKLSPFAANVLETEIIRMLNRSGKFPAGSKWHRQDPDFPDAVLRGAGDPLPGMEIKMWFPLATEITARFRETQANLQGGNTSAAVIAWLPEFVLYGMPKIVGIFVADALSLAHARDNHYHTPPTYLVSEPEDTTKRTRNLQQRNCNGHAFQGTAEELREAEKIVKEWGAAFKTYSLDPAFQQRVQSLIRQFKYRLDTNFAKIDRIEHPELEQFKTKILGTNYAGKTISEWAGLIAAAEEDEVSADDLRQVMKLDK